MAINDIRSWQQGQFIDKRQYRNLSNELKENYKLTERLLVRPSPEGNAICHCHRPEDAAWIAQRLNLASKLEQMTYDFATGKTDGSEIVAFVQKTVA